MRIYCNLTCLLKGAAYSTHRVRREQRSSRLRRCKGSGAEVIEVNTKETRLSKIADVRLVGSSADMLPRPGGRRVARILSLFAGGPLQRSLCSSTFLERPISSLTLVLFPTTSYSGKKVRGAEKGTVARTDVDGSFADGSSTRECHARQMQTHQGPCR